MAINVVTIGKLISGEAKAIRTAETGYSRLKGVFTRSINYNTYDEFVSAARNKTLGNLPDDILQAKIRTSDEKSTILKIQEGFAKAADELHSVELIRAQKADNINIEKKEILKII